MKVLLELYICFLRIGCINFGGGYAMLPVLQKDLEEKKGLVTTEELMDYFAIGQCTPGIIALNVSAFIGYKKKGIAGAAAANAGFLTVPVAIILIVAAFLTNFADYPLVRHAFSGIRVCVCVLIIEAVIRLWKGSIPDKRALFLYIAVFLLTVFSGLLPFSVPAAALVIASGLFGVLFGKEELKNDDTDSSDC